MSGFVAIIAQQRTISISEDAIATFANTYQALRGAATRHAVQAGSFARVISFRSTGTFHRGIATADDSWAVVAGLVHSTGSLIDAPLAELDGQFALIRYDAGADELVVASDPLGMFALYIATRDHISYVSTSALALAALLHAAPDRLGLLSFVRTGSHFGTLTNWQGIERLDPAVSLRFTDAGLIQGSYWRPTVDEAVQRLSFRQTVDHCIELLSDTYRTHLAPLGPVWSDLTAGYDSRLLNLLLQRAGVDFHTNTTGDPQHIDVRLAQEVAAAGGWDWTSFALPNDWPQRMLPLLPTTLGWSDSNLDVIRLSQVLWTHAEKSRRYTLLLNGGGYEHLSGRQWLHTPLKAGKTTRLDLDGFMHMLFIRAGNTAIFATDPTPEIRADFRRRLLVRAAPYSDDLDTVKYNLLSAYKQMGHHGAYSSAAAAQLTVQMPAFFKSVFTTAISIRAHYRSRHRLMSALIERLDPRVAAVHTQAGSPAESMRLNNLHRFVPYYATLGRKAVAQVSRRYLGRTFLAPAPVFNDRVTAARRALLDELSVDEPFVAANLRSAALYDAPRLDELLRSAYNPDFTQTDLLGKIITIELALQRVGSSVAS